MCYRFGNRGMYQCRSTEALICGTLPPCPYLAATSTFWRKQFSQEYSQSLSFCGISARHVHSISHSSRKRLMAHNNLTLSNDRRTKTLHTSEVSQCANQPGVAMHGKHVQNDSYRTYSPAASETKSSLDRSYARTSSQSGSRMRLSIPQSFDNEGLRMKIRAPSEQWIHCYAWIRKSLLRISVNRLLF